MNELEKKVYNGEHLTDEELCELSYGDYIDIVYGSNGRWQRNVSMIFKINDKLFELDYMEGLTEYQETTFNEQPYEVFKHEIQVTKVIYDTNKD